MIDERDLEGFEECNCEQTGGRFYCKHYTQRKVAAATHRERERCARVALEQRCERGIDWDSACLAIHAAIRGDDESDDA